MFPLPYPGRQHINSGSTENRAFVMRHKSLQSHLLSQLHKPARFSQKPLDILQSRAVTPDSTGPCFTKHPEHPFFRTTLNISA